MSAKYNTVAIAVRMEVDKDKDDIYLVFKVIDESFKQKIREDWLADRDLMVVNKNLVERK